MDQFKKDLRNNMDSSPDLNLLRMLESRIIEVIQIEKEVKKKYPKLYTQRLPRYMRRRAASHNPHRIPKWLNVTTIMKAKDRRKLYRHREVVRHEKHKRILKRHSRHKFKDCNKSILHKWFAKRFKMGAASEVGLEWVPLHNNTKNFRNLYRQTRYGCAYFSLANLIAFRVKATLDTSTMTTLNQFCHSISGFTFAARSLERGNYEIVIHLYETKLDDEGRRQYEHVCPAFVSANILKKELTLWVARLGVEKVEKILARTKLSYEKLLPRDATRVRLTGPEARKEALRIADNREAHDAAILDVNRRLQASKKLGLTIGRHIEETNACFTYYQTNPLSVDIVFRNKIKGRMLWHKLIKNKAHLVGGKRDVDELFKDKECFQLKPDCC